MHATCEFVVLAKGYKVIPAMTSSCIIDDIIYAKCQTNCQRFQWRLWNFCCSAISLVYRILYWMALVSTYPRKYSIILILSKNRDLLSSIFLQSYYAWLHLSFWTLAQQLRVRVITHPRHILVILNLIRQDPLYHWKIVLLLNQRCLRLMI